MTEPESSGRVFYVTELGSTIKIKSTLIAKKSDRAFVLEDTISAAPLNRPKKVLIKGIDLIAFSEAEALHHYLNQKRQQMIDMEITMAQAQQLIDSATEALRVVAVVAPSSFPVTERPSVFLSDLTSETR